VTFGWTRGDGLQAKINTYSMLYGTKFLEYTTPANAKLQNTVSAISMDMNYIAVAFWGDEEGTSLQVVAFDFTSKQPSVPIRSYLTPGSMFSVDIRAFHGESRVQVVASGKHTHANLMGNGGDLVFLQWEL